jgi:deoxyribose-phosphate aldolase
MFDHSLLQPQLTDAELDRGLALAVEYNVASVCIKPYALKRAARLLAGTRSPPAPSSASPRRASHPGEGVRERTGDRRWATELDMVVNVGKVLSGEWNFVADDIRAVVEPPTATGRR